MPTVRLAHAMTALLALPAVGCAGIRHEVDYRSSVRHEPMPVRAEVSVLVDPKLREAYEDAPERVEYVRQTLQTALVRDLRDNGPLLLAEERPDARLVVVLERMSSDEAPIWIMTWMIAPLWLFGVPMNKVDVELGVRIALTNAAGETLHQSIERAKCRRYEGVYYGHEVLTYGCPAEQMFERMRDRISLDRARILAGVQRARPPTMASASGAPSPPRPFTVPSGPAVVAAVFQIQDLSGQFDDRLLAQLSVYLSSRVGQKLGFKIVPQQTLRDELLEQKRESFRDCYDESCQIELGKAVAASKVVSTNLIRVGGRCVVNATVFDLATEATDRSASVETGCGNSDLLDGVRDVIEALAKPAGAS